MVLDGDALVKAHGRASAQVPKKYNRAVALKSQRAAMERERLGLAPEVPNSNDPMKRR